MDTRVELIQKAFDSNAFITSTTSAGYVNPEIWERELLAYEKANLVVAPLGKSYDRTNVAGDTFNITVGVAPSVASAVAETDSVAIQAFEKTQVVFTPTEYGTAYEYSNKEADRTFINLAREMTEQLGYALALKKDSLAISTITSGAGNSVIVNDGTAGSLTSSDTLNYEAIVNARMEILKDNLRPKYLIVNPQMEADLLKLAQFSDFSKFGDQVAKNGFIGKIAGLEVYSTTQIPATSTSTEYKALVLGEDAMGVPAFGILQKRNPYFETDYRPLERRHVIVAVEDYDIKVLRANAICTILAYVA